MALVFGTLLCRGTFKAKPTIPKATEIATLQEELGAWGQGCGIEAGLRGSGENVYPALGRAHSRCLIKQLLTK